MHSTMIFPPSALVHRKILAPLFSVMLQECHESEVGILLITTQFNTPPLSRISYEETIIVGLKRRLPSGGSALDDEKKSDVD